MMLPEVGRLVCWPRQSFFWASGIYWSNLSWECYISIHLTFLISIPGNVWLPETAIVSRWVNKMKLRSLPLVSYSPIFSLASGLPYLCYGFRSHITLAEPMHVPPGNVREILFHGTNLWPIWDGARELTPFSFILLGSPKNLLFIWTLRRLSRLTVGTRVLQSHEHLYSGFHLCCPLHPGFLAFL